MFKNIFLIYSISLEMLNLHFVFYPFFLFFAFRWLIIRILEKHIYSMHCKNTNNVFILQKWSCRFFFLLKK